MAERGTDEPEQDFLGDHAVNITRIVERYRTVRCVAICGAVVVCVYLVVRGAVQVVQQPPWLWIGLAVVTALLGPSGVIIVLIRSRRRAVLKHHRRVVELERRLDPQRTSSMVESETTTTTTRS